MSDRAYKQGAQGAKGRRRDAMLALTRRIGHPFGYLLLYRTTTKEALMEVKDGDVLVCTCEDCDIELTVTRSCSGDECTHDSECELVVMCCGEPMKTKE